MTPRHLTTKDAADYLQISVRTLERYRSEGTGPKFARFGNRTLYRTEDIDAWLAERTFRSSRDARNAKAEMRAAG